MMYSDDFIREMEQQEKDLQFSEFTNNTALELGLKLVEKAKTEDLGAVTIDITRNGHQLFHYAFNGTSPDNDQWIIRKNRVVNRFNTSSLLAAAKLRKSGKTVEEAWHVSSFDFAANGGGFPIRIKNVGVAGTITVSGLAEEEDHAMVVGAIKEYLNVG